MQRTILILPCALTFSHFKEMGIGAQPGSLLTCGFHQKFSFCVLFPMPFAQKFDNEFQFSIGKPSVYVPSFLLILLLVRGLKADLPPDWEKTCNKLIPSLMCSLGSPLSPQKSVTCYMRCNMLISWFACYLYFQPFSVRVQNL